jgi:hypothetical protein
LCVFDEHVEIAVVIEDSAVNELEFRLAEAAPTVLLDEPGIGELSLWILVKHPEIGVARRAVEVVIELLHVLAVVALAVCQAEKSLLEDRIAGVPHSEAETKALRVVR